MIAVVVIIITYVLPTCPGVSLNLILEVEFLCKMVCMVSILIRISRLYFVNKAPTGIHTSPKWVCPFPHVSPILDFNLLKYCSSNRKQCYCSLSLFQFSNCAFSWNLLLKFEKHIIGEFPGGPTFRTLSFHCQGCRFSPGWETKITTWPQKLF